MNMIKSKEKFRSDFGIYSNTNLPHLYAQEHYYPPFDSNPDTLGNMSFGTGAIGYIRQDIQQSIRQGFGRETGSYFPSTVRRRFNIDFQRASYNKAKYGVNEYTYECGLSASYYPTTYVKSFAYSQNYDPYPYYEDEVEENNTDNTNNNTPENNQKEGKNKDTIITMAITVGIALALALIALLFFKNKNTSM